MYSVYCELSNKSTIEEKEMNIILPNLKRTPEKVLSRPKIFKKGSDFRMNHLFTKYLKKRCEFKSD